MSFREQRGNARSRAHSPADKAKVRDAFIDAGRRLFAGADPSAVSLRRIATEAGYSPATIYRYFADQRALFFAIRERDLEAATERLERIARDIADPAERVRAIFDSTVCHWLENPDEFDVLFSRLPGRAPAAGAGGTPFADSAAVKRSVRVYTAAVDALFASLPAPPMPVRLAVDTLIATSHGIVAFPRLTANLPWSDTRKMARCAIDAIVDHWIEGASPSEPPEPAPPRGREGD